MDLHGMRVLVVEDHEATRELLVAILTFCGADVVAVGSVRAAMEVLERTPVSAVVSDISMPEEDGYALVRRIRESGFDIPSVAVTAHRYEHTRERTLAAGFRDHLTKPVEATTLCHSVAAIAS